MKNHQQDDSAPHRDQHGRQAEAILVDRADPKIRGQYNPGHACAQDAYDDVEQEAFSLSHKRTGYPADDSPIEEPHDKVYQFVFSRVNIEDHGSSVFVRTLA